jgi:hypothetical protein
MPMALWRQRLAGSAVLALLLAGCGATGGGTGTVAAPVAPPAPVFAVGDTFTFEDNGVRVQEQVTGFSGHRVIWQNDRGVTWIQSPDVISPPVAWSGDPRLGQGNQQVFGEPAKLFPLGVGKSVKFQVAGTSEKLPDGWQAENSCTVLGQEKVTVKAGDYLTWRIACQRGEVLETIYYLPEGYTYALRTRERAKEAPYERKELLGVSLAQTPDRPLPAAAAAEPAKSEPPAQPAAAAAPAPQPMAQPMAQPVAQAAPARPGEADLLARIARLEAMVAQLQGGGAGTAMAGRTPALPPAVAAPAVMAPPPPLMPASGNGRYGAHLGSYRSVDEAKAGWATLARAHPDLLSPLGYQTAEFDPGDGRGVFIRLLAGPFEDRGRAEALCKSMQSKRAFCRVLSLGPA